MFLRKRIAFTLFFIGLLVCSLFLTFPAECSITLRIGHIMTNLDLMNQSLEKVFKPYIEEKTNGEIKIEVYPNELLGHAPDMIEGVRIGTQAMFIGSGLDWFESIVPKLALMSVPFLFMDRDHMNRWIDEVVATEVQQEVIKKGNQRFINLRGFKAYRGPVRVIASRKPIFTPGDLKGLRLRMWPARTPQRAMEGYGCDVRTIDWSEAYLALQQGVVDAITAPLDTLYPQKFTEVVKYVTEWDELLTPIIISINEDIWQNLTKEQKQIIIEAKDKAGRWYQDQVNKRKESTIKKLIREHDVKYIRINTKPFVDLAYQKVIPDLVSQGLIREEWVREVESLK